MTLQAKLDEFKRGFEAGEPPYNAPRAVIDIMHKATAEPKRSGQAERAKKVGHKAPSFTLKDPDGNEAIPFCFGHGSEASALSFSLLIDDRCGNAGQRDVGRLLFVERRLKKFGGIL